MTGEWSYRLEHLVRLSNEHGIYEHALGAEPRIEHGMCTDDNARLLIVLCREPDEGHAHDLARKAMALLIDSQTDAGLVRNRFAFDGFWRWIDPGSVEDCWGRAVWAMGVAASSHPHVGLRAQARWAFDRSVRQRSPYLRAMAFAALGAADLVVADANADAARALLADFVRRLELPDDPMWPWPEARLTYANAAIAEALLAAGLALSDERAARQGLHLLSWLVDQQTRRGHLSVVGVGGMGPGAEGARFDQQPIEVAALADACWRAWIATGERRWAQVIALCADWFVGRNDSGTVMWNPRTGGGYDGLRPDGRNLNQGAESTLAFVSTMQRARALLPWPVWPALAEPAPVSSPWSLQSRSTALIPTRVA